MSELGERFRDFRVRFNLRDEKTQLTLASIAAAVVVVMAVIALPGGGDDDAKRTAGGASTKVPSEGRSSVGAEARPDGGVTTGRGPRSSSTVSGPAPETDEASPGAVTITSTEVKVGITYTE